MWAMFRNPPIFVATDVVNRLTAKTSVDHHNSSKTVSVTFFYKIVKFGQFFVPEFVCLHFHFFVILFHYVALVN